jgi:thymidylate kinase
LADALRQRSPDLRIESSAFPTRGQIGLAARQAARDGRHPEAVQLLFAADKYRAFEDIESVYAPDILIYDRYIDSGIAYGIAGGISAEWLLSIHANLPKADLTFWLDVPLNVSMATRGDDIFEESSFQIKARRAYSDLYDPDSSVFRITRDTQLPQIAESILAVYWAFKNKGGVMI